jgi:hypothetical protein
LKEDVGCCFLYRNPCHFSQELRTVRHRVFKKDALLSNETIWGVSLVLIQPTAHKELFSNRYTFSEDTE